MDDTPATQANMEQVEQHDHIESEEPAVDAPASGNVPSEDAAEASQPPQTDEAQQQEQEPPVPLTPPEDGVALTEDGGVIKKVLEPGEEGSKPTLHARCLVHYVGYLCSNGAVFMDTRKDKKAEEPMIVVAGRTASANETGLSRAVATMNRGERALVYVTDPQYGYGSRGSFSFPCVPPDAELVYDVELIGWEALDESDNDRGTLLFEERLERAERRRLVGNQLFTEGRYKEALDKYALSLSYLDEDFMYQLEGHYLDKAERVKLLLHLNMAAVQLKTGDNNTAVYNCTQALSLEPGNVKALFRRGKARHALGRTEEALEDLEAANKKDPSDKAIIAEMHALRATMKKERAAQAALFKGRLKAAPGGEPDAPSAATRPQISEIMEDEEPSSSGSGARGGAGSGASKGPAGSAAGARSAANGAGRQAGGDAGRAQGGTGGGEVAKTGFVSGILLWLWSLLVGLLFGKRSAQTA